MSDRQEGTERIFPSPATRALLPGDFQHATLEQCWSAERQFTADLVGFDGFPPEVKRAFVGRRLVPDDQPLTRCPGRWSRCISPPFQRLC